MAWYRAGLNFQLPGEVNQELCALVSRTDLRANLCIYIHNRKVIAK